MTFSDQDLLDYLNGAASAELAASIEAAVVADETLEESLMALDPMASSVKAAFAGIPAKARLPELPAASGGKGGEIRWTGIAAAVVLAAGIGFGASYVINPPAQDDWVTQVAIYQALYVPETVAPLNADDAVLDAQFLRAEEALGRSLDRAVLAGLDGLELKRAQILAHEGLPLIQVAFAAPDGTPFAFCIIRNDSRSADDKPDFEQVAGLAAAHWDRTDYSYMLVGGQELRFLEPLVATLTAAF